MISVFTPIRFIVRQLAFISCIAVVAGCSTPANTHIAFVTMTPTTAETILATRKPEVLVPVNQTPTRVESTAEPVESWSIHSPLAGFEVTALSEIVTTPFERPQPGMDDGHHGVDFSFYTYKEFSTIEGIPVSSVFTGVVVAVINNRLPYGNMLIIETALDSLPQDWVRTLNLPEPIQALPPNPRLNCPPKADLPPWDSSSRSIYLLYAHLLEPAAFSLGDPVNSGEVIAFVGNSGASGNPHLHLEARVGPANAIFPGMAHYSNDVTDEEMSNYCAWRIGGTFQMIDPMLLFGGKP